MNKEIEDKMTREQWILINQMSNAIWNMNAVFCGGRNNQDEYNEEELDILIKGIADKCDSVMTLEDTIWILEQALEKAKVKLAKDLEPPKDIRAKE